ncbi:hypothetical protein [Methylobacterium sp. AMS5]|uniref:hypothetical protein n=1 Tax=Methylobacterium sp. AMS5 TaxID=925818 RepID=UPI00074F8ED4|nr:hypothetical protein [Methylobacterium sp. AMS5]AMB45499.1 hypothetical protein Y590_11320 [Methylobacterium sp. AMS5]
MRRIAVALTLWTASAQAGSADDPAALRSIAAEAARITALKNRCPAHVGIDVGVTETLQGTVLMHGIRQAGKEPFMRIVKAEQARIRTEIETTGVAAWCRGQKSLLERPYPDVFRP